MRSVELLISVELLVLKKVWVDPDLQHLLPMPLNPPAIVQVVPLLLQRLLQSLPGVLFVVYNQNAGHHVPYEVSAPTCGQRVNETR